MKKEVEFNKFCLIFIVIENVGSTRRAKTKNQN